MGFMSTMNNGEKVVATKIREDLRDLQRTQVFSSVSHIELSMDKAIEQLHKIEIDTTNKDLWNHLDNIYWHIGAIKGACK